MAPLTERVLDCCRRVRGEVGDAHSEAVYHRALEVELRLRGIPYQTEKVVTVEYRGYTVGAVRVDLLVDDSLVVELKAAPKLYPNHVEQALKYLALLGVETGLVVNMTGPEGVQHREVAAPATS